MRKQLTLLVFILSLGSAGVDALPNPASVNCGKQGGKSVILKNTGICVFSDETYCEEWAFYKGKCKKGETKLPLKVSQNNAKEYCTQVIENKSELIRCTLNS